MNKSISLYTDCFIIYLEGGSFRGIVSRTFISRSGSGMTWSRSMTSDSSFPSLLFWKTKQIKTLLFTIETLRHLIKKLTHTENKAFVENKKRQKLSLQLIRTWSESVNPNLFFFFSNFFCFIRRRDWDDFFTRNTSPSSDKKNGLKNQN